MPARLIAVLALVVSGAALALELAAVRGPGAVNTSAPKSAAVLPDTAAPTEPPVVMPGQVSRADRRDPKSGEPAGAPPPMENVPRSPPLARPALQTLETYAFTVGENPPLDIVELDTKSGPMAQLELVVPLDGGSGEIVSVEMASDRGGSPGQGSGWRLVEDFAETNGEIRIPLGKRLLRDGETMPADPVKELAPGGIPRLVRISVALER